MNASTSLIRRRTDMPSKTLEHCHEGEGELAWVGVLGGPDVEGRGIRFFHDDVLPPGASIGVHRHEDDEEYYYVVSGSGRMTLDDESVPVGAGDITAVYPGGRHGLVNDGDEDLRVLVISVSVPS